MQHAADSWEDVVVIWIQITLVTLVKLSSVLFSCFVVEDCISGQALQPPEDVGLRRLWLTPAAGTADRQQQKLSRHATLTQTTLNKSS